MMKNTSIVNSVVTIGKNNVVRTYLMNNEDDIKWDVLKSEFLNIIKKLPEGSDELEFSIEAYDYIVEKDKNKFLKLIKDNIANFTSSLFSTTASAFLIDFIKKVA
ncbi:hypothetical protein KQI88_10290 [Alkaliphilus sp. MSJ-5]|uniref:Uncharacterized protein n=1 Tax=Alkaliphilus flagellatus TaxID=2841507 RepID=A0ABS6G2V8_9FIRM|nr:hypothetical protein [Alkaliphilus flagellatus]MBU5676807.1 hypothetical protein [Alkaliphilus flagellatus]